jgi:hypothetical protein
VHSIKLIHDNSKNVKQNEKNISPVKTKEENVIDNHPIHLFQNRIGNQQIQRMFNIGVIQPKLKIGSANDKYEHEAQNLSEKIIRMSTPSIQKQSDEEEENKEEIQTKPISSGLISEIQTQSEEEEEEKEEEIQAKSFFSVDSSFIQKQFEEEEEKEEEIQAKSFSSVDSSFIQKQFEEEEEKEEEVQAKPISSNLVSGIQTQSNEEDEKKEEEIQLKHIQHQNNKTSIKNNKTQNYTSNFIQTLSNSKNSGTPLSNDIKSPMEYYFNSDFTNVKVHTDSNADSMNKDLKSHAFTHKNHIYFGRNKYNTNSTEGKKLIAHELTHVIQQKAAKSSLDLSKPKLVKSKYQSEIEADNIANQVSSDHIVNKKKISSVKARIQRFWNPVKFLGKAVSAGAKFIGEKVKKGVKFVGEKVSEGLNFLKEKALNFLTEHVNKIPGYYLLTIIIEKDPITNKTVKRNAFTLIRGILSVIPGGNELYKQLMESKALENAFVWFNKELKKLNLTWKLIKGLFSKAWNALSPADITSPLKAWEKIKAIFLPPVTRLVTFVKNVAGKIVEFIFEGFLRRAGPLATGVLGVIKKAKNVFVMIIKNPIGFIGNLIKALHKGFQQFSENILDHLKAGLMGWLFGALSGAGLKVPEKFDIKGIVSIILQILGLTYERLRKKLVKRIGEKPVSHLEKTFEFVKIMVKEGLAGAWKKIVEYAGSLKDIVIGAIRNWVITKIVKSAISKLVSMFNPAGAVVQAIITIYNTIEFFIKRFKQIMGLANSVLNSIGNIAKGKIIAAANYVEQTMRRTIPFVISFLASLIGLGGISEKIKEIIIKIQKRVDKALDKILNLLEKKARKIFTKVKGKAVALIEWWKKSKKIKVGKKTIKLGFEGSEKSAKLYVSASPKIDPIIYITQMKDKIPKDKQKYYDKYITLCTEINKILDDILRGTKKSDKKTETEIENKHGKIADLIKILAKTEEESKHPKSIIRYGPVTKENLATEAEAKILSDKSGGHKGSPPKAEPDIWKRVMKRRKDNKKVYIRGHLLNQRLYGPGLIFNLTPLTYSANANHYHQVEKSILNWVIDKKPKKDRKVFYYKIKAIYNRNKPTDKKNKMKVDESKLCSKFVIDYHPLKRKDNGEWIKKTDDPEVKEVKNKEIENIIP